MVRIDPTVTGERCSLELLLVSSIEPRSAFKDVLKKIRSEYPSAEIRMGPDMGFIAYDPAIDFSTLAVDMKSDRIGEEALRGILSEVDRGDSHTSFIKVRGTSIKSQRIKPSLEPQVHIHFQTNRERSVAQVKQDLPTRISNAVVIPGGKKGGRRGDSTRFALKTSETNREVKPLLMKFKDIREKVETRKMFLKCFAP